MFAVIETGGKQYIVKEGDILRVEKLDAEPKSDISFEKVLMVGDKVGSPYVKDAKVEAKVIRTGKARKIIVFKFKRRKGYQRKKGHRQHFTEVKITKIVS